MVCADRLCWLCLADAHADSLDARERMERIEKKIDALLAALADEQEPKQHALATLDDGTLDLDSDWSQTL